MDELLKWKNKDNRKPLIIKGARQVGKTWIMKEFGEKYYKDMIYINFDANNTMASLFEGELRVDRLLTGIELYTGKTIDVSDTLLIFDEIQEVPRALSSLKYFYEDAPNLHIVCAGSFFGIALHNGTSFPVGKTDFITLYPLSFEEFLMAMDKENFEKMITTKNYDMMSSFSEIYIENLKYYYFVGGMPEVVRQFAQNRDFNEVRKLQSRIIDAYEQDFSKHAPTEIVPRIRMVWNSITVQLTKENKKFIFGVIREGGRAKDFEMAIMWLVDCGLVHKVARVKSGLFPSKAYKDFKAFKLFLLDVGLLSCMTGMKQKTLLEGNSTFVDFKGALTEQYVLQQLVSNKELNIYYYTNERNTCEVDFVVDDGEDVIPIEVKAEVNLKAKSLKVYKEKFQPKKAYRVSMKNYKEEETLTNVPLYAVSSIVQK